MSLWAFYGRVSGTEQSHNNSIPTQREACHQRAQELGATEVLDFIDAGVPGDLVWTDRPALNQLLELVEKDAIHGVLIYDPDRLARDLGVQLAVTDIISKHRVRLEFITQQYDASPEGMLFYQLRGAISQFERAKIRERTNRGRRKLLREGIPANNPNPYALSYNRETNTWTVNEEQAAVIRQIFRWAREGNGPNWIARQLNEQGITPPRGGDRWWSHVIQRILVNQTFTGTLYLNRWNMEGQRKNRFLPRERRTKATQRPEAEWIPAQVPAIVDAELWEAVQAILGDNRQRWAGINSPHHTYLASRLIRCGLCGSAMTGASSTRKSTTTYYYRCNGRYGEKRLACEMPHLRAAELDAALWQEVREWLVAPERYQQVVHQYLATRETPILASTQALAKQLADTRADIGRLQDLIDKNAIREHEVRGALKSLREKEASLAAKLATPEPVEIPSFTRLPVEVVDKFNAEERREHIRGVLASVTAFPDGRLELTPREKLRLPVRG